MIIGIFVAVATCGAGSVAWGQVPSVALRWNAPEECPDDAELVHAVEGFLGESPADASHQQLANSQSTARK